MVTVIKKLLQPGNTYDDFEFQHTEAGLKGWVRECSIWFKHWNLKLIPESIQKSRRQWWDSCNPSTGEVETEYRMLSGVWLARQSRICELQVHHEILPPKNNLERD